MLWSRITAILLVVGAVVWIASGALTKKRSAARQYESGGD